jgi:hypothetical protein
MKSHERAKILAQLSRTKSERALASLRLEAEKAAKILREDVDYITLSHYLDEMEIYGFRISNEIVEIAREFLGRLSDAPIEYTFSGSKPPSSYSGEKMRDILISETIKLLRSVRYHAIAAVLDIVLPYAQSSTDSVNRAATDVLTSSAKFNMDLYYGGEGYRGMGATPQIQILDHIETYRPSALSAQMIGVASILGEMLSPDMNGDDWDYDKVTLKFGSVPATGDIKSIRERAIALLCKIYAETENVSHRRLLLGKIIAAASMPSHGAASEELGKLIGQNTLEILDFVKSIVESEDMQIIQKIEHDIYWLHYHASSDDIKTKALQIRDLINTNDEYGIYRNLIGFEGVFDRWEDSRKDRIDFKAIDEGRAAKIVEYVKSINHENWSVWRARIIDYAKTESEDLATFPKFYEFLEKVAIAHPTLALSLLVKEFDAIKRFAIPIYRGLWTSPHKNECKKFLLHLIANDRDIIGATRLFLSVNELDYDIVGLIVERATENEDQWALTELVGVACAKYSVDPQYVIERIFRPAITTLNRLGSAHWIENIWFNKDARELVTGLGDADRKLVFLALAMLREISYRAEEILVPLVAVDPDGVIELFGDRILNDERSENYEAIPFRFYRLQESLAAYSELLVQNVRAWYRDKDPLFQFTGGKFLAEIYPAFDDQFSGRLIQLVSDGSDEDIRFVIAVMRNYEGEEFLHKICREIVLRKHRNEQMMSDVKMVLYSTGVVSGEYGHAKAYEKKILEMKPWLDDSESEVVKFAIEFIEMMQRSADNERERADEEIALRKHRFGHQE